MFDYPIPSLRGGLYEQLGVGPEADSDEIADAREELVKRLQAQKTATERQLEAVYREVPELRETYQRLEHLDESEDGASPDEYRSAQIKLSRLEEQARLLKPDFTELREQSRDLQLRIHEVNRVKLQNAEVRLAYDRDHPPFELLKLADATSTPFDDSRLLLDLIRTELSDFFEQSGEQVYHPSDLTCGEFFHDFTENPLLDGKS